MSEFTDPYALDSGLDRRTFRGERSWVRRRRWLRTEHEKYNSAAWVDGLPELTFAEWQQLRSEGKL